jgi:hypothetical protein
MKYIIIITAVILSLATTSCDKCKNCKEHTQIITNRPIPGYPVKITKEYQECEKADEIHNTSVKKVTNVGDTIEYTETVVWECK